MVNEKEGEKGDGRREKTGRARKDEKRREGGKEASRAQQVGSKGQETGG